MNLSHIKWIRLCYTCNLNTLSSLCIFSSLYLSLTSPPLSQSRGKCNYFWDQENSKKRGCTAGYM
uniref:Uncharacterized protein n=1 Tax=Sinocyclocheilus grahami TaxID=75366 RepID=A0A672S110_SINGR